MTETSLDQAALERLSSWMDGQGLAGPMGAVRALTGGTQNLLLRFEKGGRSFVLRQPPPHTVRGAGETIRREAEVLAALADTEVPHAHLVSYCADEAVTGAPFFLMDEIKGFNVGVGMPALHAGNPEIQRQMGLHVVEALAAISRVDYVAAGLADFGKPVGFLDRQVERWRAQLAGYTKFDGWPGPTGLPGVAQLGEWLDANRPNSFTPGLMHGDYHLKNVLFREDGPQLAAVIDWELATIGAPLVDLGWLLATWPGPGGDYTSFIIEPWDGFPTGDELVEHYGRLTGTDLTHVLWYKVLACYKLALIIEGTFARACAGKAPMDVGERLHGNAVRLLRRAERWLAA
jgi:aminoglycoside phosphotransferase (APT) family kinase protein